MKYGTFVFLIIVTAGMNPLRAQFNISVLDAEDEASFRSDVEFLVKSSEDSSTLARSLNRTIRTWRESGYLQANLDILEYNGSDIPEITIFVGPKYEWAHLRILGVPASLQDKLARYPQKITDEPVEVVEVMKSLNEVITFSENHGYPFAEIRIDSLVVSGGYVSASLVYKAGPYITFDSIYVMGNAQIKSSFLGAYLGILPGRPFRQKALANKLLSGVRIPPRIRQGYLLQACNSFSTPVGETAHLPEQSARRARRGPGQRARRKNRHSLSASRSCGLPWVVRAGRHRLGNADRLPVARAPALGRRNARQPQ